MFKGLCHEISTGQMILRSLKWFKTQKICVHKETSNFRSLQALPKCTVCSIKLDWARGRNWLSAPPRLWGRWREQALTALSSQGRQAGQYGKKCAKRMKACDYGKAGERGEAVGRVQQLLLPAGLTSGRREHGLAA